MIAEALKYTICGEQADDGKNDTELLVNPGPEGAKCTLERTMRVSPEFEIDYQQMYELGILFAAIALNAEPHIDKDSAGELLDGYGIPVPDVLKRACDDMQVDD